MYDVIIIGGGVTGCSVARLLSRYQLRMALFEKEPDVCMGASKANSAIVHGGFAEPSTTLKGRLCYTGRQEFAKLDSELHFGFSAIGSLVLAFTPQQAEGLQDLLQRGRENGLRDLSILIKHQVIAIEPNVNPDVVAALYCKGAGVCSPFEYTVALAENAIENGLELFLSSSIASITKTESGFTLTTAAGEEYRTRYIVNAAGLGAGDISALVGDKSYSIHSRSGEYILLRAGSGSTIKQVLFQMPTKMGKGILVTPTIYGNLLIGPDAIDEESTDRNTHPARLEKIHTTALQTTKSIDINLFLRSFAGARPVASTGDFIIEESKTVAGFIQAAGIQSPGLTASPAVADMVRGLLQKAGLGLKEKADFQPYRRPTYVPHKPFAPEILAPMLDLPEGAEGRMLCRCEQVPEALVRDAATRGIKLTTVDAIKRRTHAGMGLCQGNFCRPRTASLLTGINGGEVTPVTDPERDGLQRVTRQEFLTYLKEHPPEQY
ncbi:MAG: NAD(P)/FAD-dependent oxidoreductase [Oscillospiraceae bacterium]